MLGRVLVKKSSFLGATLNLHRGKTVNFFSLFQVHMIAMVKISQTKKNQSSLSCLYPEIWCDKTTLFFLKRVILWAPTVYRDTLARYSLPIKSVYVENLTWHQRIWIINRSPRLTFCRPKLLQILSPSVLSASLHSLLLLTPTHPPAVSPPADIHGERISSRFGRQRVEFSVGFCH